MSVRQRLNYAIANKKTISFSYHNIPRIAEPHHYGILKNTDQLHAYQIKGASKSGNIPQWRNFKLDKIKNLVVNDTVFIPESSYNPSNAKYKHIIKKI